MSSSNPAKKVTLQSLLLAALREYGPMTLHQLTARLSSPPEVARRAYFIRLRKCPRIETNLAANQVAIGHKIRVTDTICHLSKKCKIRRVSGKVHATNPSVWEVV